ncbi:MAG: hypothetical protein FWC46_08810, partial [Actinomycetia bacterium]|nr:hypothetical protein [Actinomycetes bacterium]
MSGRNWQPSDTFRAQLCPLGGATATCVTAPFTSDSASHGTLTFPAQTFSSPGTYRYAITESSDGPAPGVTYSQASYVWTVTVTDDGSGQLRATTALARALGDDGSPATGTAATATFANRFDPSNIQRRLEATKVIDDVSTGTTRPPTLDYQFTFAYVGVDLAGPAGAAPPAPTMDGVAPAPGGITATSSGQALFGPELDITAAHAGHTWFYRADEAGTPARPGLTYSTQTWFWAIAVGVDGAGVITLDVTNCETAASSITPAAPLGGCQASVGAWAHVNEADRTFVNTYDPAPVQVSLDATKTLAGRPVLPTDSFTFTLSPGDAATATALTAGTVALPASTVATVTAADFAGGDAAVSFGPLTFTKPGAYQFWVDEDVPPVGAPGLTYDGHTAVYDVLVTDPDAAGALRASVTVRGTTGDVAPFTNTFEAHLAFDGLDVAKQLDGRALAVGEFSFTIAGLDTASCVKALLGVACAGTVADGEGPGGDPGLTRLPGEFNLTQADIGRHYRYSITENAGTLGGVTYDSSVYTADLAVSLDPATSQLYVVTTITKAGAAVATFDSRDGGTPSVTFTNTYAPAPVSYTPVFSKTLTGRAWAGDAFDFTLRALTPGAPLPASTSATVTAAGSFGFGAITFTAPGTYEYAVTEDMPATPIPGVAYSGVTATVTITVTDDGAGQLVADAVYDGNSAFLNTYVTGTVTWSLDLGTVLHGATAVPGQFAFALVPDDQDSADALGVPLSGTTWANAQTLADGLSETMVPLPDGVVLTQADAGHTYCYQAREVVPDPGVTGMTYDPTVYHLCLAVTEAGAGVLTVTTTITSSDPSGALQVFVNASDDDPARPMPSLDFVNTFLLPPAQPGAWTLAKTSDPAPGTSVRPGDVITYTITATPTVGDIPVALVDDDLSTVLAHATLGTVHAPAGTTASLTGTTLTWLIGDLASALTLTYTVTVNDDAWDATLVNAVVGLGSGPGDEPIPPEACALTDPCTVTHATPPQPATPGWTLAKTSDPAAGAEVQPGQAITYALTATPHGGTVGDVTVTDDLAALLAHTTLEAISPPTGTTASLTGTTLTWTIGDLTEPVTLYFTVLVNPDA